MRTEKEKSKCCKNCQKICLTPSTQPKMPVTVVVVVVFVVVVVVVVVMVGGSGSVTFEQGCCTCTITHWTNAIRLLTVHMLCFRECMKNLDNLRSIQVHCKG